MADKVEIIADNDYVNFREMVISQNIDLSSLGNYENESAIAPCYPVVQDTTEYTATTGDGAIFGAGSNPQKRGTCF